jgi:class 3 adenylate cyclase
MDAELTFDELKLLRQVTRAVDDVLEESLKARESLQQTFARLFPVLVQIAGAKGAVVSTLDEELAQATFSHGDFGDVFAGTYLQQARWGVRKLTTGDTLASQALDLVGLQVGSIGLLFSGDRTADAPRLGRLLETVAEQLDTVLAAVQTASEKHQVLVTINHALSNRVFETGMDGAVRALSERVKLPGFLLIYRDAVESGALHYRSYKYGQLEFSSNGRRDPELDAAIRAHGQTLIQPHDKKLHEVLGSRRAVETVLISGVADTHALGKIMVWGQGEGFSAFTMELLRDPNYERTYLAPRAEEVGILFADINGFTRICEQVLERPERIGKFVDDWSEEAVRILHRHGGVFDKMVGDCVIGLFGPPFFKDDAAARATATVKAAIDIQAFTRDTMSAHPEISRLSEILQMPGLGVAIGVNLTPSFCGLFGPNRNYTSFSTGMNQTARLQSLGSFRETLVMDTAWKALHQSADPEVRKLNFGPLVETPVKNVAQPLRYYKLLG